MPLQRKFSLTFPGGAFLLWPRTHHEPENLAICAPKVNMFSCLLCLLSIPLLFFSPRNCGKLADCRIIVIADVAPSE